MFGIGVTELMIIGAIALVLIGPEKLPSALKSLGKFVTDMKRSVNEVKHSVEDEINDLTKDNFQEIAEIKKTSQDLKKISKNNIIDIVSEAAEYITPEEQPPQKTQEHTSSSQQNTTDKNTKT